ncbi:hypothetical protein GCM10007977_051000 [Dactylosporangium sucinum]|uniref:Uncharacterized protein n=1 Tax=Dactylosporangium sucinum TaxID=1424081 RepID=A0A917TYT3_9ACTN|nr:hypothetical protein GCM10007977_051000 [Dactylosporangium sucinum]
MCGDFMPTTDTNGPSMNAHTQGTSRLSSTRLMLRSSGNDGRCRHVTSAAEPVSAGVRSATACSVASPSIREVRSAVDRCSTVSGASGASRRRIPAARCSACAVAAAESDRKATSPLGGSPSPG